MDNIESNISDCYLSISEPSSGIYKDKGSKFLAFAYPVRCETEIKDIISRIKKEYYDARHHCYAYRLGYKGDIWRFNDDGEPSSTAGKPIYGQLLSNRLSDILVVVVRYFGGIKLGVPGLIKAYKSAAQDAIAQAQIIEKTATENITFRFYYENMNSVMKILKDMNTEIIRQDFDNECIMEISVRLRDKERFLESIQTHANIIN